MAGHSSNDGIVSPVAFQAEGDYDGGRYHDGSATHLMPLGWLNREFRKNRKN